MQAARPLFAQHGFSGVGTEAIVAAAGVTRGALYHQFGGKTKLFEAVYEAIEEDLARGLGEMIASSGVSDPIEVMALGAGAWLDACGEQEVQQIVLLDGPAVLGWARWREIGMHYALGLIEGLLAHAIEVGRIPPQPVRALAHVFVGALDEAGLYIARAEDQPAAREEMREVIATLVAGLGRR
ncbi:MAG TPA: TetR/AcrR family transcriptional regulator [Solirubrobacteraceae bacterium]|nr:TetR/AcrR family transcriptional regulator [Solirubrobacteraceae bacterium]